MYVNCVNFAYVKEFYLQQDGCCILTHEGKGENMKVETKRKITGGALAVAMLLGASSFAYFTDKTESTATGKTGTVTLEGVSTNDAMKNMAPGDVKPITLSTKYTGTLAAKTRVTFKEAKVAFADGTVKTFALDADTPGFGLMKGSDYVNPATYVIDTGVKNTGEMVTVTDLTLKLNEVTENEWQGATVEFVYVVEALQDAHTTAAWEEVGGGAIAILPV